MKTKTYRAPNMLAALQNIQRDLGPDAVVISMREVTNGPAWQVWSKPGVEVIATTEIPAKKEAPARRPSVITDDDVPGHKDIEAILTALAEKRNNQAIKPEKPSQSAATNLDRSHLGTREDPAKWSPPTLKPQSTPPRQMAVQPALHVLEQVVDEIMETAGTPIKKQAVEESMPPMLKLIRHRLLRQGIKQELINHLTETNLKTLSPVVLADEGRLTRYIKKQLEAALHPQKNSMVIVPGRIMCVVGATGSGKTSTCAKLAAYYYRTLEKKVIWICADTVRAGAISETRTYAEALQIPYYFAYTPQELNGIIVSNPEADLILMDTPGINPLDEDKVTELATYLNEIPPKSIFITVPSTTKYSDLNQMIATFSLFKIRGLIVTKMDETYSFGDVYNVLLDTHLPVLYFTNGSQVVGRLHQGEPGKLVDAIFGEGI